MNSTIDHTFLTESGRPRRWHFGLLLPALFQPRQTFARIVSSDRGLVSTPLLVLVLLAVIAALVAGAIKEAAAASGQVTLPPGFEWYTPEQQAQFMQAMTATSGPIFLYVLPAIVAVLGVIAGWLLVGWLLHLVLTLMGGRAPSSQTLNVVAWASLPFAVRHLVRIGAMLAQDRLIDYPGLSGFVTGSQGNAAVFANALLGLVDIYLIWHIALLIIGVRAGDSLSRPKVWTAVLFTVVLVLILRALPALVAAQFSDITVVRPFFF